MGDSVEPTRARVAVQQCLSARLQTQPQTDDCPAEFTEINRGMIVYLCFMKGATSETVEKMVKSLLYVKLCESSDGRKAAILDLPGDLLVIPQFCLGGKMKGKAVQYHGIHGKTEGQHLFHDFVQKCQDTFTHNEKCKEAGVSVKCGTYGNRQVLSTVTNGPFTHIFEF